MVVRADKAVAPVLLESDLALVCKGCILTRTRYDDSPVLCILLFQLLGDTLYRFRHNLNGSKWIRGF